MRDQLGRVQRDNEALTRRMGELSTTSSSARPGEPSAPTSPLDGDSGAPGRSGGAPCPSPGMVAVDGAGPAGEPRPCLRVVKLTPSTESARAPEAPTARDADDAARPVLVEDPLDRAGAEGKAPTRATERAIRREYETAADLVRQRKPKDALDAWTGFVVRHPEHALVVSAQLQRARCYVSLGDLRAAETQLEGVLATHPGSGQVPEVLLELGLVQQKLGESARAQATFERLRREFPKSEAARKTPRTEKTS